MRLPHIAAANDHETESSCDDVEATVIMANEFIRPTRHNGLSSDSMVTLADLAKHFEKAAADK